MNRGEYMRSKLSASECRKLVYSSDLGVIIEVDKLMLTPRFIAFIGLLGSHVDVLGR
jgi:hypothetical protein